MLAGSPSPAWCRLHGAVCMVPFAWCRLRASVWQVREMDCSCFTGVYVTDVGTKYLDDLAKVRTSDRGATKSMTSENMLTTLQITEKGNSPPLPKAPAVGIA